MIITPTNRAARRMAFVTDDLLGRAREYDASGFAASTREYSLYRTRLGRYALTAGRRFYGTPDASVDETLLFRDQDELIHHLEDEDGTIRGPAMELLRQAARREPSLAAWLVDRQSPRTGRARKKIGPLPLGPASLAG